MSERRFVSILLALGWVAASAGCAADPTAGNPSFPVTIDAAREDLARMAKDPRPARRPIVILGGFADPGLGGWAVGTGLRKYLRDPQIVSVSFVFCDSFDVCRRRVIEAVDREFPNDDPNE